MVEIEIKMKDYDRCVVCGAYIGKGNDQALSDNENCKVVFDFECSFNKWAKEEMLNNRR
jgi:hypothetical protein